MRKIDMTLMNIGNLKASLLCLQRLIQLSLRADAL
ncbi:hypothetical protein BC777_0260 [Yoonia maricola]|uniref:Uncharacterized protein n=1 Tax=Yoonia maricola TaxID=420999 RepID=A0A2M8WKI0_9RHOB|nr:hypothetical protein BC777_0260 [Yoonia maricola]